MLNRCNNKLYFLLFIQLYSSKMERLPIIFEAFLSFIIFLFQIVGFEERKQSNGQQNLRILNHRIIFTSWFKTFHLPLTIQELKACIFQIQEVLFNKFFNVFYFSFNVRTIFMNIYYLRYKNNTLLNSNEIFKILGIVSYINKNYVLISQKLCMTVSKIQKLKSHDHFIYTLKILFPYVTYRVSNTSSCFHNLLAHCMNSFFS